MTAEAAVLAAGSAIAPGYEVIAHISRGRTLDVYDVWSEERACRCIAKTIRPDRLHDGVARRRLEAEGRLLRRLTHPHIVRGYERPRSARPVEIMETIAGETLAHLIEGAERLVPVELGHLGLHLCSAIQYLHRNGVLHLDLKPSNVIAEAGRAKIIDLSVARRPGRALGGIGTWCYMSPEQVWGGELTAAADVWGIGVVLWEAAAGEAAFGGEEDGIRPSGDGELEPEEHPQVRRPAQPIGRRRRLPRPLAEAIDRALAATAEDRPSLDALTDLFQRIPGVVSSRATAPASAKKRR